jgi:casein kinase II subunit beta
LIEIDDSFLQSSVSYYDLHRKVPHYSRAAEIVKGASYDLTGVSQEQIDKLANSTRRLYGLLHQRFANTDDGVDKLSLKVNAGVYGFCPRVACKRAKLIPMGFAYELEVDTAKAWCPKCHDVYDMGSTLDGAYFGPDLPMMFLKISGNPLRFQAYSKLLEAYDGRDGPVPRIPQRLVRWGEVT